MDNDDKKYIPSLRFPEFLNDGEWVVKTFENIVEINSGKDYKHLDSGNIPVYGTGGYMLSVNDKLSDVDAVGIGRKGTIDKPQFLKAPFWTVDTLFYLINKNEYNINFILYLAETIDWKKYSEQTGVPSLSKATISKIKTIVPNVIKTKTEEQKRIADCLSSLDKYIDATKRKLEQLKEHKKGVMQRIFPTKGKTIPELRFSKFKGKWIEKKLGQMCHLTNGMAFKPSDWKEKGIPIVRIQNLNDENASFNYCDPDIIDNKYMIDTGTLLFSWSGTPGTSFGAYIWNRGKAVLNQHIFIVKTLGIDKIFFKMIIDANMASIIEKSHGGAGLRHITKTELENIKVFVSEDDIEQRKIASFLLSMDNIISVYTNKLNLLVEYKKGLMQQLFPKL